MSGQVRAPGPAIPMNRGLRAAPTGSRPSKPSRRTTTVSWGTSIRKLAESGQARSRASTSPGYGQKIGGAAAYQPRTAKGPELAGDASRISRARATEIVGRPRISAGKSAVGGEVGGSAVGAGTAGDEPGPAVPGGPGWNASPTDTATTTVRAAATARIPPRRSRGSGRRSTRTRASVVSTRSSGAADPPPIAARSRSPSGSRPEGPAPCSLIVRSPPRARAPAVRALRGAGTWPSRPGCREPSPARRRTAPRCDGGRGASVARPAAARTRGGGHRARRRRSSCRRSSRRARRRGSGARQPIREARPGSRAPGRVAGASSGRRSTRSGRARRRSGRRRGAEAAGARRRGTSPASRRGRPPRCRGWPASGGKTASMPVRTIVSKAS